MIRKHLCQVRLDSGHHHHKHDSTSTDSSLSPRSSSRNQCTGLPRKEKLELCKKFIEFGCCPYKHKCKFAHGSHELRKNNHKNSLYKTKECAVFFREGYCHYGDRCNFLHKHKDKLSETQLREIKSNFKDFFADLQNSSRLLQILP